MSTVRPSWGYLLIEPLEQPEVISGGLVTPTKGSSNTAKVREVGEGQPIGNGQRIPMNYRPGLTVYFKDEAKKYPIVVDNETLYLIDQLDIIATID